MRFSHVHTCYILAASTLMSASAADFSGVWKLKSGGGGLQDVTMVIERTGDEVRQRSIGMRGTVEQRSEFKYKMGGESMNNFRGEPMKSEAKLEANTLEIRSQAKTPRGEYLATEMWKVSSDGNTMVIQVHSETGGRGNDSSSVFERAPASAAEVLNRPEQKAGAAYKNIKLLQDVEVSNFIPVMRRFSAALGVECEHCHVANDFASDDKPAKATARKMLVMAQAINKDNFAGAHGAVSCYTCHRGQTKPLTAPPSAQ
jgi:Photosynthetic reaction centre cytochrome C subunit